MSSMILCYKWKIYQSTEMCSFFERRYTMLVSNFFEYLVSQLIDKSSCGRLEQKEREAVRVVRKFLKDNE